MRVHRRDCISPYFEDIKSGRMKFDVRGEIDKRGFWVGDLLILTHKKTKEVITCRITYLFDRKYGLWKGLVIIGIEVLHGEEEKTAHDEATKGSFLDERPHTSISIHLSNNEIEVNNAEIN